MVEVTKSNFKEVFPLIEKSIRDSSFIAIDTEFTGLNVGPSNENNLFDNLSERYEKLKCRAKSFIPCQIGLSTFTKEKNSPTSINPNSYKVESYVFYVRPCMVGSVDRIFMFQGSAVDFLCRYNFNFQKFIEDGIPYINENEEQKVHRELEDGSICLPHEKLQDPRYQADISQIINKRFGKCSNDKLKISKEKLAFPIDKKSHVYFQLKEIRRKFQKCWAYVEDDSIIVKMVSPEERKQLEECKADEIEVLDYFLGFTKVFRVLKKYQKPLVGHNLLMDLMLFYHNFHQNLPDSYDKFKKELHSIFPVIYDTKHIWMNVRKAVLSCFSKVYAPNILKIVKFYHLDEFVKKFTKFASNSGLPVLFELFKRPPDYLSTLYSPDIVPLNCKKYMYEEFVHDSGYDAFITGYVFMKICHVLAIEKISVPACVKPQTFKQHLDAVSPFVNKVNFPYFRLKYVNLEGPDPLPQGLGYLYISPRVSSRTLSYEELNARFSKHSALEFKFVKGQKAALAVVQNSYISKKILNEFKDDSDLIVEEYNFLRHSPYVSTTLWLTAVTSGCLLGAWIWKSS